MEDQLIVETLAAFERERAEEEIRWWRENHKPILHPFKPQLTNLREMEDLQDLHKHLVTWTEEWFQKKGIAVKVTQEGKQIIITPA